MIGIYKITNNINGKYYIGKSKDIEKRWNEYKWKVHNIHLKNAIEKYGFENFNFEIIEICSTEDLNVKEKYYIDIFKARDHQIGYNIAVGGDGGATRIGYITKDNTKNKISKANTGKKRTDFERVKCGIKNIGNKYRVGKKISEEHKDILRKSRSKPVKDENGLIYESVRVLAKVKDIYENMAYSRVKKGIYTYI